MKNRILTVIALTLLLLVAQASLPLSAQIQVPGIINYQGRIVDGGTNFNGTGLFEFALLSGGTNSTQEATATAVVNSGFITSYLVDISGSGYTSSPTVTITDCGAGSGALAHANVSGGMVTSVVVSNDEVGESYSCPTVTIAPPPPNITYTTCWSNGVSQVVLPVTKGLYSVLLGDTTVPNMATSIPATVFTNTDIVLRVWFNDGVNGLQELSPDQRIAAAGYAFQAQYAYTAASAISTMPSSIIVGQSLDIGTNNSLDNGVYASIAGGSNNTANCLGAFIGGGLGNMIQTNATVSTIGGGGGNTISNNAYGSTIGGGQSNSISTYESTIGGGFQNTIQEGLADLTTIGGGGNNAILLGASGSTIGGGNSNTIQPFSYSSTIGGGAENTIQTNAGVSTIGGGQGNTIQPGSFDSTIAGGFQNTIQNDSANSTIGGGAENTIQNNTYESTIAGGVNNTIQFNAGTSTIGGGQNNTIQGNATFSTIAGGSGNIVSGAYGTVPGGSGNVATNNAFATGTSAIASNTGAFVWADDSGSSFASTSNNQFSVRASGGVAFFSNAGATTGVILPPGSGSWNSASDRNLKAHFAAVNPEAILQALVAIPVDTWNYKAQDEHIHHIGPMAQDFHAAFGVGEDDKHISEVDAQGVAFSAIQGLNQKLDEQVKEKDAQIAELRRELGELKATVQKVSEQMEESKAAPIPAANVHETGGM
jgi:hypothetical protein